MDSYEEVVNDALEKAAKMCDEIENEKNKYDQAGCGDAIRALINKG